MPDAHLLRCTPCYNDHRFALRETAFQDGWPLISPLWEGRNTGLISRDKVY